MQRAETLGYHSVVRRIDIDALNLPGKLMLQRFASEQVVAEDQAVVELIVLSDLLVGMI